MKKMMAIFVMATIFHTILIGGATVKISDVNFNKSFYLPNEPITVKVNLYGPNISDMPLKAVVTSLNKVILEKIYKGASEVSITFKVPAESPKGYGLDLYLQKSDGKTLSEVHRGFDVLKNWTERPMYGFLTDFSKSRISSKMTMNFLAQYHINGLQYYDWMYDYGQLVYPGPGTDYTDAWSRTNPISETTIENLINTGHEYNIASMAYVAIYAMTKEIYEEHPDWALYEFQLGKWKPVMFNNKLVIAAPDNKGWSSFLISQCEKAIQKLNFDGIHLDQYGYPKDDMSASKSDDSYHLYKTSKGFVNFINDLKSAIAPKTVYFNCVNDWPAKTIQSQSHEDAVYIEPWESCNTYSQLFNMINSAKAYSKDKPVILAAYIKHFFENSIFYADSLIFASGAQRLELGEYGLLLDGPYFPGDAFPMSDSFMQRLRNYYDFSVRYENLLYGKNLKILDTNGEILSFSVDISSKPEIGKVFVLAKENTITKDVMLHFINYTKLNDEMWREWQKNPEKMKNLEVTLTGSLADKLTNYDLYFVSVDDHLNMEKLNVSIKDGNIEFSLPSLEYWSSIVALPR